MPGMLQWTSSCTEGYTATHSAALFTTHTASHCNTHTPATVCATILRSKSRKQCLGCFSKSPLPQNTLQYTLQHTLRNTLQHTATQAPAPPIVVGCVKESLFHRTHCSTLCNTLCNTHCNTPQHTATHCNTLQHTTTHCNTLQHTTHTWATNRRRKSQK